MPRAKTPKNPADRVLSIRLREPIRFPDLSERLALKLIALPHYAARAHFGIWHRHFGLPNRDDPDRIFTPLVFVDLETQDLRLDPDVPIRVRGRTELARTVDEAGETQNLVRDGRYDLLRDDGELVARVRFVNFFTRSDPEPARRRITRLPESLGLGDAPSRVIEVPRLDDLVRRQGPAHFTEPRDRVWHYDQTDPNRHVNAFEYLRALEEHVATSLAAAGHDLAKTYVRRARIVYRKPCFRGEAYRREAWTMGESPPRVSAAVRKGTDPGDSPPAVVAELTLDRHE